MKELKLNFSETGFETLSPSLDLKKGLNVGQVLLPSILVVKAEVMSHLESSVITSPVFLSPSLHAAYMSLLHSQECGWCVGPVLGLPELHEDGRHRVVHRACLPPE